MTSLEDRFVGCLLGLALGDALGAPHEGGLVARSVWRVLGIGKGATLRWTDDTEMAVVLARSLTEHRGLEPDALARAWADEADWKRGYGQGAMHLLARIRDGEDWREANRSVFPAGSFGNGAAMRAAPLGLWFHRDPIQLTEASRLASSITHAHPLGIEGGVLIARATALALGDGLDLDALRDGCHEEEFRSRLDAARAPMSPATAAKTLGNAVVAHKSAVTAVHAALHFAEFVAMIEWVVAVGGDTDTIGAMAGAIFGARHGIGALPRALLDCVEEGKGIESVARKLYAANAAVFGPTQRPS